MINTVLLAGLFSRRRAGWPCATGIAETRRSSGYTAFCRSPPNFVPINGIDNNRRKTVHHRPGIQMRIAKTNGQRWHRGRWRSCSFRRIWLIGSLTLMLAGLLVCRTGAGASAGMTTYSVSGRLLHNRLGNRQPDGCSVRWRLGNHHRGRANWPTQRSKWE